MANCKHCGESIPPHKDPRNVFCSHSCRAKYCNPSRKGSTYKGYESKQKIREETYNQNPLLCKVCSKPIPYKQLVNGTKKSCSRECYLKDVSARTTAFNSSGLRDYSNCGGLREGAGRGKTGWYKDIFCSSTYELAYLIYCIDHNIPIVRNTRSWEYLNPVTNKVSRYYPDFVINEKDIVEIKGIQSESVEIKLAAVRASGERISILYKEDLQEIFDYVVEKTGVVIDKLHSLYEKTKHLHLNNCRFCGKDFESTQKNRVLCSQSCAGKERAELRWDSVADGTRTR